jgi:uncharacterized protein YutE (UPF0331/DUF86 family)
MLDRERILARLDCLETYLGELKTISPQSLEEYTSTIEKRRSCERLLQLAIECVVDICHLLVSGLRLGLPSEEDDLFEKLEKAGIISSPMKGRLKGMKGFRNILVHEYEDINDLIVYDTIRTRLGDFEAFRGEVVKALQKQ